MDEGELRLDLGVLGESLGHGKIDGATVPIELIAPQPCRDLGLIGKNKIGEIHQDAPRGFGCYLEGKEDRPGEGISYGPHLRRIVTLHAEVVVRLDHQKLFPMPFEGDDPGPGTAAPIQTDVVGAQPGCQARHVEHFRFETGYFHPELVRCRVVVEGKETVQESHASGVLLNGRKSLPAPPSLSLSQNRQEK